ncbi:MAG TPA: adenine deaminase [Methanocorpusculum sp.]|nr:adenine deaminase [Methanocorpusculum sp.]
MKIFDNACVYNPVTGKWIPSSFSVEDGKITTVAKPGELTGESCTDLKGARVIPGLIDAHIHIESTLLPPHEFGKLALSCGVTTVIADPHEIGNVAGTNGVDFMLEDAKYSAADIFFMVPSCVPATPTEIGGAVISAKDLEKYTTNERVLGLGEMMNVPGVLCGDSEVKAKLALFDRVDGHAPCLGGKDLDTYIAAGIKSDHECTSAEEAREKLEKGLWIFLREGDAAKNVASLAPVLTPETASRCCFATDDRHADFIRNEGTIDNAIRIITRKTCLNPSAKASGACKSGTPIETALRAATLSPAEYFGLEDRGILAPGKLADFCTLKKGAEFRIDRVWKNGVERRDIKEIPTKAKCASPAFSCRFPTKQDLVLPDGNLRIIGLTPGEIVTEQIIGTKKYPGAQKIVCVDRYAERGFGVGLIAGLDMKKGAIATSVAHDAHNIVASGATDEEILAAIHAVASAKGGMTVVVDGKTTILPLDIAGLMSSLPADEVCENLGVLAKELAKTGAQPNAFMSLSFMCLTVIPHLKITPRGLFDGDTFSDTDIRIE